MRSIKQTLKMDVLRCKTPEMVRKEFWGHLLVANLIRGVMAEAARRHGVLPRRVELPGGAADDGGVPGRVESALGRAVGGLIEVMLRMVSRLRVGDRPDRYEPRVRKRRAKAYPLMHEPRRQSKKLMAKAG